MSKLCSLTDVKLLLGINDSDTSEDAKLNLYIKETSAKIENFIGYSLSRGNYVEELHNVNNRQLIQLNHFPIQAVSEITENDKEVTDYKLIPEYTRWGRVYRGEGWTGAYYTRGFTHDIVSGVYSIKVSYTAGYYLPDDTGYVEGASDSLPYDIVSVCIDTVVMMYNFAKIGATGLKSHSEGHISESYGDEACSIGLSESAKLLLSKYVFYGVA